MKYDKFGRSYVESNELADMLYQDPNLNLHRFFVVDPIEYNSTVRRMYLDFDQLKQFQEIDEETTIEQFDQSMQHDWKMPEEYASLDIAQYLLDQCKTDSELQRVGEELLLFHERDLFDLLRYLKYMVDTFRKNNIVWGLGRGSSVASYILYLLGVHKINSMYYDLDISEFLR